MDAHTLYRAMGQSRPLADYESLVGAFNAAMIAADCTTVERAAMWCAQLGHESVGLKYMRELWGPTSDQRSYDGRMGNGPGEGYTYRGRGPIQLTGKDNYRSVSAWAYGKGLVPTPTYFVDNPDAAADTTYGFTGAVWYWTVARSTINSMCDTGNVVGVTRAINGGTNGLDDRVRRYRECIALGNAILPRPSRPPRRVLPLDEGAVVTDTFGYQEWRKGVHWGVDYGKPGGSGGLPVYAMQGGTVTASGPASGFGRWINIDHPAADGGGLTVYGHIIPEVRVGTRVEAGQRIATIDPDNRTNGGVAPHLHIEVHRYVWSKPGNDRLDPAVWLAEAGWPGDTEPDDATAQVWDRVMMELTGKGVTP